MVARAILRIINRMLHLDKTVAFDGSIDGPTRQLCRHTLTCLMISTGVTS